MTSTPPAHVKVLVPGNHLMVSLLGQRDEFLRLVEGAFPVSVHVRGNEITVTGAHEDAERVARLFEELVLLVEAGHNLDRDGLGRTIDMFKADQRPSEVMNTAVLRGRKTVRPKTAGQKRYVDAIRDQVITFGIGPAGTGKTYLAVALAVEALQAKRVNRIVLTRPAVEAGERLGFLPGDVNAKIDPYLRPLYDALYDMVEPEAVQRLLERGSIEIAPLAYMRGRAQPLDTPVLTPQGFRPIGELTVGDHVVGSDGAPTLVLGVYPQPPKSIFRVCTDDGASTLASGDHLWAVRPEGDQGGRRHVLTTATIAGEVRGGHRRYELPLLSRPAYFPPREVPVDPYRLGLLLGDPRLADDPTAYPRPPTSEGRPGFEHGRVGSGRTAVAEITRAPEAYLYNTPTVRIALLQGLMDSPGGSLALDETTPSTLFFATSSRLRDDVVFLVRSLGGVASCRTAPAGGRRGARGATQSGNACYRLDIRLPAAIDPFRDRGSLHGYRTAPGRGDPVRFIDRIEPVGTAEAVCIRVAAPDSLYVTEGFILTHNTLNDSFIIMDEAQNTTAEQMKMFLTRFGFGSKAVVTGDVTQIDLPDGRGRSGLLAVRPILEGIPGLTFVDLGSKDVVRHRIVQDIVDAYQNHEERR